MTPTLGQPLSWMNMKEDEGDPTGIQNITSSFVEGGGHSLDFHRRIIHDFPPKTLIIGFKPHSPRCSAISTSAYLHREFEDRLSLNLRRASKMPKKRAQPPTPPAVPSDSRKKEYYPAGNTVYYCQQSSKNPLVTPFRSIRN